MMVNPFVEVRFLKDLPAIVGADMYVYGPFKAGRVYALPKENARIFLKLGVAKAVREELEKPTLKEMFKGEVLDGYVEATKVIPLDVEEKRKKLREQAQALIKAIEEEIRS